MRSSMNQLQYTLIYGCTITAPAAQSKEAISPREGQYFSIVNNTINGFGYAAIRIGDVPVGSINDQQFWNNMVVSDNTIYCPTSYAVAVNAGAQNILIGNNTIHMSDSEVPVVVGNVTYGRYTTNVQLLDNQTLYAIGVTPSKSLLENVYAEDVKNTGVTARGQVTATGNTIGARAPATPRLAFSLQPVDIIAGATIPAVKVAVIDGSNAIITGDTSAVTITSSAALTGTTTVNAVAGIATFSTLSTNSFGTFTLTATDGIYSAANSTSFTVTAANPPPIIPPVIPPVTPPVVPPPTLPTIPALAPCAIWTFDQLAYALRIDVDVETPDEEDYVMSLQCAAVEYAETVMGCSLLTRTITKTFWKNYGIDWIGFSDSARTTRHQMPLPDGPIQSITSINDANGAITDYEVIAAGSTDLLKINQTFTAPVTVVYVAGYGDDSSSVPADIKAAIRTHVATLYERRESAGDRTITAVPHSLEAFYQSKARTVQVR